MIGLWVSLVVGFALGHLVGLCLEANPIGRMSSGSPPPFFSCGKLENWRAKKERKKRQTANWPRRHIHHSLFPTHLSNRPLFQQWQCHAIRYRRFWQRHGVTSIVAVTMTSPESSLGGGLSTFWMLLFVNQFLSVVRQKKQISDFWDLNPGPKSRLQSSRHYTTTPPPP